MKKGIFLVAAFAMNSAAFAQLSLEAAAERQREIIADIDREQTENGPLSPGLIDPLTQLTLFYEEIGDDGLAIATTERVLQVIRANHGLYSIEQAAMVHRLMDAAESHGDAAAAWDFEQELLELARRNPHDIRTVPILKRVGDRRIDLLEQYIGGEYPQEIELGCYFAGAHARSYSDCAAGSLSKAAGRLLAEAHDAYLSAIDIVEFNESYASEELRQLEWEIVNSGLFHGRYLGGSAGCRRVDERLARLHEYDILSEAPFEQQVESLLHTADWKMYCNWNTLAHKSYASVLSMLEREGASQTVIDRLFAPEIPVLLPAFTDNNLVTEEPYPSAPFVDIAFEVTRYGTTRNIQILEGKKTPGAGDVMRLIKRKRFRPYASDGELVDSPRLVVRYFPTH